MADADWPLIVTLFALSALGCWRRDWRMAGTAMVLASNALACTAYVVQTVDLTLTDPTAFSAQFYPWPVFGAIDYVSGFLILKMLPGRLTAWQGVVGLLYAAQLVCHGAVGIEAIQRGDEAITYYQGFGYLWIIAWAQCLTVVLWGGYGFARHRGLFAWSLPARKAGFRRARQSQAGEEARGMRR